jgi:flavin-dependent dehydrogenase
VRFTWCLEDPVTAVLPGDAPFWIVRRAVLDRYLREQAAGAGAEVRCATRVEGIARQGNLWQVRDGTGDHLQAAAVVIADGSSSRFAELLGLGPPRPRYAVTVSVEVAAEVHEPETARFEFGLVHHGFCWSFPRQGGYSIGLGTFIGRHEGDSEAVLAALLPSPLHGDGLVVAGDAASIGDPFLAEGLRPSLMSGTYAAEALDSWLGGEAADLAGYTRRMRAEWGDSMAWGKRIAQVFYRVPRVGYQLGVKRPTAPQRIAQILSGEMGYGDIAQRVIRRLLFQRG